MKNARDEKATLIKKAKEERRRSKEKKIKKKELPRKARLWTLRFRGEIRVESPESPTEGDCPGL